MIRSLTHTLHSLKPRLKPPQRSGLQTLFRFALLPGKHRTVSQPCQLAFPQPILTQ